MNTKPQRIWALRAFTIAILAAAIPTGVDAAEASDTPRVAPDFTLEVAFRPDTLQLSDIHDSPVLLCFFDAGDVPTRRAVPYANEWYRRYENDGLKVVGIHCPQSEPLKDRTTAETAIADAGTKVTTCLDTDRKVYNEYGLTDLFAFILLRPGGEIAYESSERRAFQQTEAAIQDLLKTLKPGVIHPFLLKPLWPEEDPAAEIVGPTPTIKLGHAAKSIAGCDSTGFGKYVVYTDPRGKEKGRIYLDGKWKVDEHSISYKNEGLTSEGRLRFVYSGKEVWLLPDLEPDAIPRIFVKQNRSYIPKDLTGKDVRFDHMGMPFVHLRHAVPVNVVKNLEYGTHELELIVTGADATFYYLFFVGAGVK
jgi:hypothetical protein